MAGKEKDQEKCSCPTSRMSIESADKVICTKCGKVHSIRKQFLNYIQNTKGLIMAAREHDLEKRKAKLKEYREKQAELSKDPINSAIECLNRERTAQGLATYERKRKPYVKYSTQIAKKVCKRIANGESPISIGCDDTMPSEDSISRWEKKHPEFTTMIAQARLDQADFYANLINELSFCATNESANRIKMIIDSLKWTASHLRPERYSQQMHTKLTQEIDVRISASDELKSLLTEIADKKVIDITPKNKSLE